MMFSLSTIQFVLISVLSLSANAENVRGAHRELTAEVNLGTAGNFAILSKTGITTTGTTAITGDIGVSPITAAAITGFSLTMDSSNAFSTSTLINGQCFASDYVGGSTQSEMGIAVLDMQAAYTDAESRTPANINVGAGLIGGLTLLPGVYSWTTAINIATDVTLAGGPDDRFILQTTGNVIVAGGARVTLSGGAVASNIVWQVAGLVTVGAGAHLEGTFLVNSGVAFAAGCTMNGRVLAQTAVTLIATAITAP
jgi:hypothetical protein